MNPTTAKIHGPQGLIIELDRGQIFPDDPGAGTPAIVTCGKNSATFWCAVDTGELDAGEVTLTESQIRWLIKQHDKVEEFLYG